MTDFSWNNTINELFFGKSERRIALCQSEDGLNKITHFNYDINNMEFIKYFQKRTGLIITGNISTYKSNNELEGFQLRIKQRLQDCWEIWKNQ